MTDTALQEARAEGVYLFGAGQFARDVARALRQLDIQVHAFLTSKPPTKTVLDGMPLQAISAKALAQAPVWVAVFNREPHSDYALLHGLLRNLHTGARLVWPQHFYAALEPALGFRFWLRPVSDYAHVTESLVIARALLDDEGSRRIFDQVVAFRRDVAAHALPPSPQGEVQYLPDWLREEWLTRGRGALSLVDGGAYRGETLLEIHRRLPLAQAWTFEPDAENHAALVRTRPDWPIPMTHVPAGLGATSGVAAFTPGQGEGSRFAEHGSQHVAVVALDECLHHAPINFIKLDVEGHEMAALTGAQATLHRQRPTLAVAAYHRWDDLWQLPLFLAQTGLKYRLRLGVHGHNSFDTVLYAF